MDINPDKPNSARIYDYVIGGHHHFAADRAAAERLLEILPVLREIMLTNRWFYSYAIEQLAQRTFTAYIDFATGLPTGDYLHTLVPAGTKILYNDIDPVAAAYAQQIIGDTPHIRYVCEDMRNIESILSQAAAFFGSERRIGIGMVGIVQHIDDAALSTILQQLYAWVAPGSHLAIRFFVADRENPELTTFTQTYKEKVGIPVFARSRETIAQVMGPWQPVGAGLQDIRAILSLEDIARPSEGAEYTLGGIYWKPQ
jgi:hypothetical protein